EIRQMTQQGHDIIRLDIGNPDLPPPESITQTLASSADSASVHGYSGYRGIAGFRQAISQHYADRFNVEAHPDREVLPLIGTKEGIINLSLAYLDRGDVALIPDIAYPAYEMGARLAGADLYHFPLVPENGFLPDVSNIPDDVLKRAKILWINYPNNPTGAIADSDTLLQLATFCKKHDILLVSDNPYVDITYGDYIASSALSVDENLRSHIVEFFSFSKTYNMAGWRLGAAVGDAEVIANLLAVKSNMDSGHFTAIYQAGIHALQADLTDWMLERNQMYMTRRDKIIAALPEIGLSAKTPDATLYIWAHTPENAVEYTQEARKQAHVSLAPGAAYGPGGEHYIRISVTVPDERLDEALDRLKTWHKNR
ncbi:MAG: aminotransferase class I/II-fold pyridoxal phosphate-dependent enzyme, partial [Aggregatilineales bacterium]